VREVLGVSERRACRTLGQHRSTQRKIPCGLPDEERLTEDIIALTRDYGRYGYRMIAGMLNNSGWHVNHKRVERIWRREGLKSSTQAKEERAPLDEPSRSIASQYPAGQWTDHVCDFEPSDQATSGRMTLCMTEHMMGALIALLTLLMNIPGRP